MKVFFFGLGYSSRAIITALRDAHGSKLTVSGTTRDGEKAVALSTKCIGAHAFDGSGAGAFLAPDLRAANWVISSIAPAAAGDPVLPHHSADLDAASDLDWLCYLSTVGVYADAKGTWINETAPLDTASARARHRLAAELAWRDFAKSRGVPLAIFRLAGIYGPGRSAFDKLRDGTARRIVKRGQVFNRIHVADLAATVLRAGNARLEGTFNLADDEPAAPQTVVTHAAKLLGMDAPRRVAFTKAGLSPMARGFYSSNKRISNAAINTALEFELHYPSYREGLGAILAAERATRT